MIVAELTLEEETVRFEWQDAGGFGLVNVKEFDGARIPELYNEVYEDMGHARHIWRRLIELGFKRTRLEHIDPITKLPTAVQA